MNLYQFYKRSISHHKWKVFGMVLGDGIQAAFMLMIPFVIKDVIDKLQAHDASLHGDGWLYMQDTFYWFVAVIVGQEIGSRLSGGCLLFTAPVVRLKPRNDMVEHLQSHSMNFFQNMHSGSLGSRINEANIGFGFSLWTFIFDVWPVLIRVVTGVVLMFIAMPYLAVVVLGWFTVYLSVSTALGVKQFFMMETISKARSLITGKVVDMATNVYAVKSFANEGHEKEIIEEAGDHERQSIATFQKYREGGGWFYSLMLAGILTYLGYYCIDGYLSGVLSVGDISFATSMLLILTSNMSALAWGITHLLEHIGSARDGVRTIYQAHTIQDKEGASEMTLRKASIKLGKVCFAYPEKPDENIFDGLNLKISAGQKVGVVGSSGAGKSTFLNLLMRFYDIQSGSIEIDGQNIAEVTQETLRSNIAVIPQDTSLFHRTLMENIRYGRLDATDDDVIEAAKQAHAHEFILKLPEGYETLVGERGVKLSGGQRQRIAIARAILKNAPILILDEATSALDSESEKAIQDSLTHLMDNKTVIAIAHRLSTIAHLDRIIVMENGKIVEDGTHDDLLKKDRHYAMLWRMQSGGFLQAT